METGCRCHGRGTGQDKRRMPVTELIRGGSEELAAFLTRIRCQLPAGTISSMHEEIFHNKAYLVNRLLQIDEFKGHLDSA